MTDAEHERTHLLGKALYEGGLLLRFAPGYTDDAEDFPKWEDLRDDVQGDCCNVAEYILEREAALRRVVEAARAIIEAYIQYGLREAEIEPLIKQLSTALTISPTPTLSQGR